MQQPRQVYLCTNGFLTKNNLIFCRFHLQSDAQKDILYIMNIYKKEVKYEIFNRTQ